MLGAIGLYFDLCLNRKLKLRHLYPKRRQHRLPKYLGQQEVKRMIEAADNIKHRCLLKLLYGAGLRVSEVPALTLADIDSANMPIHIRDAKGRKDRTVMLSRSLLADLRDHYRKYKFLKGNPAGCTLQEAYKRWCDRLPYGQRSTGWFLPLPALQFRPPLGRRRRRYPIRLRTVGASFR